jgi:hypothetical protein
MRLNSSQDMVNEVSRVFNEVILSSYVRTVSKKMVIKLI